MTNTNCSLLTLAVVFWAASIYSVCAADLYWDPGDDGTGGSGVWDLTLENWDDQSDGTGTQQAWTDGETARIGMGSHVTLGADVETFGIEHYNAGDWSGWSITSPQNEGNYLYTIINAGGLIGNSSLTNWGSTFNVNMDIAGNTDLAVNSTWNGTISGSGTVSHKASVTLNRASPNYNGVWHINKGTLTVGADNALGNGTLELDGINGGYGIAASGSARQLSSDIKIATWSGSGWAHQVGLSGEDLTFSGPTTFGATYSGGGVNYTMNVSNTTEFAGDMSGLAGDLIKAQSGTLVLSGNVSNSGGTQVADGALLINGTTSGQGNYTVDSGAVLGGGGTIGLADGNGVSVAGTLAPGSSTGTLTVEGDLALGVNSAYNWEASSESDYDSIVIRNGVLTIDDSLAVDLATYQPVATGPTDFVLFDFTDAGASFVGNVSQWDVTLTSPFMSGTPSLSVTDDQILLSGITFTPEPTGALLMLLVLTGLLIRRRR